MTTKEKATYFIFKYLLLKDDESFKLAENSIIELAKFYHINNLNRGKKTGNILELIKLFLENQKGFNKIIPDLYADIQDYKQKHAEKTK